MIPVIPEDLVVLCFPGYLWAPLAPCYPVVRGFLLDQTDLYCLQAHYFLVVLVIRAVQVVQQDQDRPMVQIVQVIQLIL